MISPHLKDSKIYLILKSHCSKKVIQKCFPSNLKSVAHRRRVEHQAEKNYFDGDLLDKTIMKLYLNNIFHHN